MFDFALHVVQRKTVVLEHFGGECQPAHHADYAVQYPIGFMLWGNSQDPIPFGLLVFLIAIPVALIIGLWIALAGRMKEIEGGEEDEASKY